jgi:hypothetical protein
MFSWHCLEHFKSFSLRLYDLHIYQLMAYEIHGISVLIFDGIVGRLETTRALTLA